MWKIHLFWITLAFIITGVKTSNLLDEINQDLNFTTAKINDIFKNRKFLYDFVDLNMDFFNQTHRYSEFLKYYSVSGCVHEKPSVMTKYVKRHILDNLLINPDVPETHWDEYKLVFNKSYLGKSRERSARAAWRENLGVVTSHNQAYLAGELGYTLHLNHFADLSITDYLKKILKLIPGNALPDPAHDAMSTTYYKTSTSSIPEKFDWRDRGFKPRLEEQWRCGACYAFAIAHALQAQLYRQHGDWSELSVQQIVDCSGGDGNYGCGGGSLSAALRYVARAGLEAEVTYPYKGKKGVCRYNALRVRARAGRWALIPRGDEAGMARALYHIGPLAVSINAAPKTFQLYRSGLYDDPLCTSRSVNHAVLLVGYTPHYWVLLNWWGHRWGEGGYMKIRRGTNRCGIANSAAYVETT